MAARSPRTATAIATATALAFAVAAVLFAIVAPALGSPGAEGLGAEPFTAPSTIAPPFVADSNLVAGMEPDGETILGWVSVVGRAQSVQLSAIAPGGAEALPPQTLASDAMISPPALSVADGRAAVAWFDERKTEGVDGDELLALELRDRLRGGALQAPSTVWDPPHRAGYSFAGLDVATDAAGDEIAAWITRIDHEASSVHWIVMVSSRRAGGSFTTPTVLTSRLETRIDPAVAIDRSGEATVLWAGPTGMQVLASRFLAGERPSPPVVLDQPEAIPSSGLPQFGGLAVSAAPSGAELASWLHGSYSGSPVPVSLRAAWAAPGAAFSPAQTVSSPGVEVNGRAVALSATGRALIAWSELTSTGAGPVLSYAVAEPGGSFAETPDVSGPLGEGAGITAAWLGDQSALITWRAANAVLADRWTPGGPFPAPVAVAGVGDAGRVLAAGGTSAPVLAWIGRSALDTASTAVRYLFATGLGGETQAPIATISLPAHQDLTKRHVLALSARCVESCALSASAGLFALKRENVEEAAAASYREVGSLRPLRRTLPAGVTEAVRLAMQPRLLRMLCRSIRRGDEEGLEARVSVRDLVTGTVRNVVLGGRPGSHGCRR
jgi:hypothetical protein